MNFINAEISPDGVNLGNKILKEAGLEGSHYCFKYNHLDPYSLLEKIRPIIKGKKVILFTAQSLEQITYLKHEVFTFLEDISSYTKSTSISFCEPVSWQLTNLISSSQYKHNIQEANRTLHNRNLFELIQNWVLTSRKKPEISLLSPSIFRIGSDIAGIQININSN